MDNKEIIDILRLKGFETEVVNHNITFTYSDENMLEAALIIGTEQRLFEQYALEVYDLCTNDDYLKNNKLYQKLLKGVQNIKSGKEECLKYDYHGKKPFIKYSHTRKIMDWDRKCFDILNYIFNLFNCVCYWSGFFYPIEDKNYLSVKVPYFMEGDQLKDWDDGILFYLLMKIDEMMVENEFSII
jgi:hypothetical protein